MCEFKVLSKSLEGEGEVAEDVVRAFRDNGRLVLLSVAGSRVELEDAVIVGVNVLKERLEVLRHPLVARFMRLVEAHVAGSSPEVLSKLWAELKEEGDRLFATPP